jgi:hypothetical protein
MIPSKEPDNWNAGQEMPPCCIDPKGLLLCIVKWDGAVIMVVE